MDPEIIVQIVALLAGGGAVSGGTAYYQKKKQESNPANTHTPQSVVSDIQSLREEVERVNEKVTKHVDRLYDSLRSSDIERASLRTDVEVLKQKVDFQA